METKPNRPVQRHHLMARAQQAVRAAIKRGALHRATECDNCRAQKRLVAHHDDYARPIDVRWLCRCCHRSWHLANGSGHVPVGTVRTLSAIMVRMSDSTHAGLKVLAAREGTSMQELVTKAVEAMLEQRVSE